MCANADSRHASTASTGSDNNFFLPKCAPLSFLGIDVTIIID